MTPEEIRKLRELMAAYRACPEDDNWDEREAVSDALFFAAPALLDAAERCIADADWDAAFDAEVTAKQEAQRERDKTKAALADLVDASRAAEDARSEQLTAARERVAELKRERDEAVKDREEIVSAIIGHDDEDMKHDPKSVAQLVKDVLTQRDEALRRAEAAEATIEQALVTLEANARQHDCAGVDCANCGGAQASHELREYLATLDPKGGK